VLLQSSITQFGLRSGGDQVGVTYRTEQRRAHVILNNGVEQTIKTSQLTTENVCAASAAMVAVQPSTERCHRSDPLYITDSHARGCISAISDWKNELSDWTDAVNRSSEYRRYPISQ
jgi:hypothetical protein